MKHLFKLLWLLMAAVVTAQEPDHVNSQGGGIDTSEEQAAFREAIDVPSFAELNFVSIMHAPYLATAGTGVSDSVRTGNLAALHAAMATNRPVFIPAGRWEINGSGIQWDLQQGLMFGEGSNKSIIAQTNSSGHGITFITSPEATTVTKSGVVSRLRIEGVGAGSATGYGINADKASTPSHAFLSVRDCYITGFARGVYINRFDNSEFDTCEFNSNGIGAYCGVFTQTVTFHKCVNSNSVGVSWQLAAGSSVVLDQCDTGGGSQHVLSAGNRLTIREGNFEAITGTPNGHIETTAGSLIMTRTKMLGNSSTLPAIYVGGTYFLDSVTVSDFGAGGGKLRKASASVTGMVVGDGGLASNRQSLTIPALDNAGQFDLPAWGIQDAVRYDSGSTASAGNRGLMQYLGGTGTQADRIELKGYDGSSYSRFTLPGLVTKTTTGNPTGFYEGMQVINTFDNTFKIYLEGAWRTVTTW
ncbi:hypothetical protein [Luteolibacter marinus]|uniref:hypothetical protein n=1 Tax=Luteolibacter marinus TaxID=2776705 RepID=UPI0018680A61|nr:hypothetical protein [Luteolibacter marinus]